MSKSPERISMKRKPSKFTEGRTLRAWGTGPRVEDLIHFHTPPAFFMPKVQTALKKRRPGTREGDKRASLFREAVAREVAANKWPDALLDWASVLPYPVAAFILIDLFAEGRTPATPAGGLEAQKAFLSVLVSVDHEFAAELMREISKAYSLPKREFGLIAALHDLVERCTLLGEPKEVLPKATLREIADTVARRTKTDYTRAEAERDLSKVIGKARDFMAFWKPFYGERNGLPPEEPAGRCYDSIEAMFADENNWPK